MSSSRTLIYIPIRAYTRVVGVALENVNGGIIAWRPTRRHDTEKETQTHQKLNGYITVGGYVAPA